MMENRFYIPVDSAIEDFRGHLLSHDRTILSAKFGDGKTFFLTKFMQDEQVKRDYKILTLYPVNYQVAENRDVFELIKYDLLIQMLVKGVIEPDFELSNAQALALCIQMKAPSLAEALLPIIAELQLDEESSKVMASILTGKKMFTALKKKVSEIKEKTRDNQILKYLNEMKKNPMIGEDVITGARGTGQWHQPQGTGGTGTVSRNARRADPRNYGGTEAAKSRMSCIAAKHTSWGSTELRNFGT